MSVIPFPEPSVALQTLSSTPEELEITAPRLRLVAEHEHAWTLRSVEYDETFEVRRYECETCEDVLYR